MIKVLTSEKLFRNECPKCGVILEYCYSDTGLLRLGNKYKVTIIRCVKCPVCNSTVDHFYAN